MSLIKELILYLTKKVDKIVRNYENEKLIKTGLLQVGVHTYGINNCKIYQYKGSITRIEIGKYCSLAPEIQFIGGGIHPTNWISLYPMRIQWNLNGAYLDGMPTTNGPITLGNDVWIGTGAIILSGVSIGNGAIVAAGSVVTKSVSPYTIVGGNPARIIRSRFSQENIDKLLKIEWWNWDEDKIKLAVDDLNSSNIQAFINKYYL